MARLKGEARMAQLVVRAVRSRQRPLRRDAEVPFGATVLRLTAEASAGIVSATRRRPGSHNARRRFLEQLVVRRLADEYLRTLAVHGMAPGSAQAPDLAGFDPVPPSPQGSFTFPVPSGEPAGPGTDGAGYQGNGHRNGHGPVPPAATGVRGQAGDVGDEESAFDLAEFSRQIRRQPELAEALDRMWPRLSAEELLHDLFGSPPLLALAAKGVLSAGRAAPARAAPGARRSPRSPGRWPTWP